MKKDMLSIVCVLIISGSTFAVKSDADQWKESFQNWKVVNDSIASKEVLDQAKKKVDQYIDMEIEKSSRIPTEKENQNLSRLVDIARKYGLNEVRIIEAETLIRSYYLEDSMKDHLLSLLESGSDEEIYKEIDSFLEESYFNEKNFSSTLRQIPNLLACLMPNSHKVMSYRQLIGDTLKSEAKRSTLRKGQVLALIAWSRAYKPMICDFAEQPTNAYETYSMQTGSEPMRAMHFDCFGFDDMGNQSAYNEINIDFFQQISSRCFGLSADSKIWRYKNTFAESLFHEIGHTISGSLNGFNKFRQPSMEIASEALVITRDTDAINENMRLINGVSNEVLQRIMKKISEVTGIQLDLLSGPTREERIKTLLDFHTSNEVYTIVEQFHEDAELMQILGISDRNGVLYINMLSDFSVSAENGGILRINHDLWSPEYYMPFYTGFSEFFGLTPFLKNVEANFEFFKVMLEAYGTGWDEYQRKAIAKW